MTRAAFSAALEKMESTYFHDYRIFEFDLGLVVVATGKPTSYNGVRA